MSTGNDRAAVVSFFLNLYKYQTGVPKSMDGECSLLDSKTWGQDYTYEFRLVREEAPISRRVTIAALGEGTGSSSKCFKVIYDNLLVVKLPSPPITTFDKYIESIRSDRRIAARLGPEIKVVSPSVSAIMKKVYTFSNSARLPFARLEDKYIKWLKINREFQKYLKINNGFAFFMDLSEYYFLSQAIHEMHDHRKIQIQVRDEIMQSSHSSGDPLIFEDKYGSINASMLFRIHQVYSGYGADIRALLTKYNLLARVPAYKIEQWFLVHLAGMEISEEEIGFPPDFLKDLSRLLKQIIKNNHKEVTSYKNTVKEHIMHRIFIQNKWKMGGTITNIMELLARLRNKGLAIRDLKPDNMFIVGDLNQYPLFLSSPDNFSIGLIDLETAVAVNSRKRRKIEQPKLGGTPAFATPSHFFPNTILEENFADLDHILYFQDWFAALGMFYNVLTGEVLFDQTRRLLRKILTIRRRFARSDVPLSSVFRSGSRIFWSSAFSEFREKCRSRDELLRSVKVEVPEDSRQMLRLGIEIRKTIILRTIRRYITTQVMFRSQENRKHLFRSSAREIQRHVVKWEKGRGIPDQSLDVRKQVIKLLKILERLKIESAQQDRLLKQLEPENVKLAASELMDIMFNCVMGAMYKLEWGKLSDEGYKEIMSETDSSDAPGSTTIVYEDTIGFEP